MAFKWTSAHLDAEHPIPALHQQAPRLGSSPECLVRGPMVTSPPEGPPPTRPEVPAGGGTREVVGTCRRTLMSLQGEGWGGAGAARLEQCSFHKAAQPAPGTQRGDAGGSSRRTAAFLANQAAPASHVDLVLQPDAAVQRDDLGAPHLRRLWRGVREARQAEARRNPRGKADVRSAWHGWCWSGLRLVA